MLNSSNSIVACIGEVAMISALSPIGNNVAFVRHKFNANFKHSAAANVARVRDHFVLNENQVQNASTAVELRDMREVSHPAFTRDEIYEMLEHVCIH